jgi:glycosyltransferase involved in cell wall biosynthesis
MARRSSVAIKDGADDELTEENFNSARNIAALPPASASLFSRVLKILILQDILRSGGTERQSIVLTKGLLANGVRAQLVTFRPGGTLAASAQDLPGRALQQPDKGMDWYTPGLAKLLRAERPDFILGMGRMANCRLGWLRAGLAQTIATYRTGKPLPLFYRRALRRCTHIIVNSAEAAATLTTKYRVPAEKMTVIYNGLIFPPAPHPEARETLRRRWGAAPQTTVFICVAMLRPEKRQSLLLDILAGTTKTTDWQLWLAGDGPERGRLERRARQLGIAGRVKFLGFEPAPSALYGAADIAVHASESEALSNFLIEAQAHGLPAVAYEAQGIAECFVPGKTGWMIPRGNEALFRAALLRLDGLPPRERAALGAAAAAFARDRFETDRQIAAYVSLLRSLQSGAS